MNVNDFVILPGSKAGTSVRLKTKTVKELQLEKAQLETENKEMERRLFQLQSNMSREKEERRKLGAYHWKSGQAGPRTPQTRAVAQNNEDRKKVSPQKVKIQLLKHVQEPVKKPVKPKRGNVAHENLGVRGVAYGPPEIKGGLLEPASASASASPEKQDKGLLLGGAFDEKASAKSFQEALLQWRKGERDPGGGLCASEVPSATVGICEVQTNFSALKEPFHVEFQRDGLSYMEKLLLKKYRRTPVDQFFASCKKDSRPVQGLSVQQAGAEGGGGDDDDDDDIEELTDEEVKKYWASIYRAAESKAVSENAESSLKIEFLDDSQSKDLEESSDSSVEETGDVGMNKQRKTGPLEGGRNPVSPKEISQGDEQWLSERSLSENADGSVVQGVLESQLNRAANALQAENQLSHLMATWVPWSGPESPSSLACEDGTSSSRDVEIISGNADFQNTLELKDHNTFDIFGDWEESQVDAEQAVLEDKQQVLALK